MAILDAIAVGAGATDTAPNANAIVSARSGEVVVAYGVNSNTAVAIFGGAWTNLLLNVNAVGKMGWQKVLANGAVGLNYAVPGTQAWAVLLACFGSSAPPVFTGRGNASQACPFASAGITMTPGSSQIAVIEFTSNGANQIPVSFSDSQGNLWVRVTDAVGTRLGPGGQLAQVSMWYTQNVIGGAGITLNEAGASGATVSVWQLYEVSGLTDVINAAAGGLLLAGVGL